MHVVTCTSKHLLSLFSFPSVWENWDLSLVLETGTTHQATVLSQTFATDTCKYADQYLHKFHKKEKVSTMTMVHLGTSQYWVDIGHCNSGITSVQREWLLPYLWQPAVETSCTECRLSYSLSLVLCIGLFVGLIVGVSGLLHRLEGTGSIRDSHTSSSTARQLLE